MVVNQLKNKHEKLYVYSLRSRISYSGYREDAIQSRAQTLRPYRFCYLLIGISQMSFFLIGIYSQVAAFRNTLGISPCDRGNSNIVSL